MGFRISPQLLYIDLKFELLFGVWFVMVFSHGCNNTQS